MWCFGCRILSVENFPLFSTLFVGGVFFLEAVGQDLNPAYENGESATDDAREEHHFEDVSYEEDEFVQY